jgi:hypothetical protein
MGGLVEAIRIPRCWGWVQAMLRYKVWGWDRVGSQRWLHGGAIGCEGQLGGSWFRGSRSPTGPLSWFPFASGKTWLYLIRTPGNKMSPHLDFARARRFLACVTSGKSHKVQSFYLVSIMERTFSTCPIQIVIRSQRDFIWT